jgi:hypothetical protein
MRQAGQVPISSQDAGAAEHPEDRLVRAMARGGAKVLSAHGMPAVFEDLPEAEQELLLALMGEALPALRRAEADPDPEPIDWARNGTWQDLRNTAYQISFPFLAAQLMALAHAWRRERQVLSDLVLFDGDRHHEARRRAVELLRLEDGVEVGER